jgi:hypothetical protein
MIEVAWENTAYSRTEGSEGGRREHYADVFLDGPLGERRAGVQYLD